MTVKLTAAMVALAATLMLLVAVPVRADFSVDSWRFFKSIPLSDVLSETSLVEVVPDREVFAYAAPALSDIRVVKQDSQQEAPYKLLVDRGADRLAIPLARIPKA